MDFNHFLTVLKLNSLVLGSNTIEYARCDNNRKVCQVCNKVGKKSNGEVK